MNPSALATAQRCLREERRALTGWAIGIAATILLELALYPTVRDNDMSQLVESYPDAVKELFNLSDFASGAGYVGAELFSLVIPALLLIPAILWGSDAIAGEEDRGTLDLLLANPIPRRRVVAEKALGVTVALAVIGAAALAALLLGDLAFDVGVGPGALTEAMLATLALAVLFGAFALALGAATGHRGLARGTTAALVVAAYLLSSLGGLVDGLRPLRPLSPWYHALGVDPLSGGADPARLALLVGLAVAGIAIGGWAFDRRDLAT